jgi:geranylgeranyl pyrophosphate synthase
MNNIASADSTSPSFVARVESRLGELLGAGDAGLQAPAALIAGARHLCLAGGKRVRPQLVEAFGEAVGAPSAPLLDVAVAAELMHAASLLHDDIVDAGSQRRGRPTVNALWGNTVAVLSGDLVLSAALVALRPRGLPSPTDAARRRLVCDAVDVVLSMTRAAMQEVAARARIDVSLDAWRDIAENKTGALFGFCGYAAAVLAEDDAAAARYQQCGRHLGVAFQLADDLGDLLPSRAASTGKDLYADIRNGNPSYPLLLAANRSPSIRSALETAWAGGADGMFVLPEQARAIGEAVLSSGAAVESLRAIGDEIALAQAIIADDAATSAHDRIFQQVRALWRMAERELAACAAT